MFPIYGPKIYYYLGEDFLNVVLSKFLVNISIKSTYEYIQQISNKFNKPLYLIDTNLHKTKLATTKNLKDYNFLIFDNYKHSLKVLEELKKLFLQDLIDKKIDYNDIIISIKEFKPNKFETICSNEMGILHRLIVGEKTLFMSQFSKTNKTEIQQNKYFKKFKKSNIEDEIIFSNKKYSHFEYVLDFSKLLGISNIINNNSNNNLKIDNLNKKFYSLSKIGIIGFKKFIGVDFNNGEIIFANNKTNILFTNSSFSILDITVKNEIFLKDLKY